MKRVHSATCRVRMVRLIHGYYELEARNHDSCEALHGNDYLIIYNP